MAKDVYEFAAAMIRKNPQMANSPEGREFLQLLETRDDRAGSALANKLLSGMGVSQEQGIRKAVKFFGLE